MPKCHTCGAPLKANAPVCTYCNTSNDIDLNGLHEYTVEKPSQDRNCPVCSCNLLTLNFSTDEKKFYIERCERCMGLFFDPNELEGVLDSSAQMAYRIDIAKLNQINQIAAPVSERVFYKKCPVCGVLMNRVNFGTRSGVVIDKCQNHGIWLDGGELHQLLQWRTAGGQLYHEKVIEEKKKQQQRKSELEKSKKLHQDMYLSDNLFRSAESRSPNLLNLLRRLVEIITE